MNFHITYGRDYHEIIRAVGEGVVDWAVSAWEAAAGWASGESVAERRLQPQPDSPGAVEADSVSEAPVDSVAVVDQVSDASAAERDLRGLPGSQVELYQLVMQCWSQSRLRPSRPEPLWQQ